MSKKAKKVKKKRKKKDEDINVDQILLKNRQLFLFGEINQKQAKPLIREIIALDKNKHEPIALFINSPGGCVDAGFAIIDIMKSIQSPIVTVILGEACSMAGLVSIAGDARLMSKHSTYMQHEMTAGDYDYVSKIKDRAKFFELEEKKAINFLKEHTKLSDKDLERAKIGELWLNAEQCVEKGIVEHILPQKRLIIQKDNKKKIKKNNKKVKK